MKIQEGVDLHFIETDKFTTNRITVRFAAAMDQVTVAGRVLVANLLEIGNQDFPTAHALKRRLASLYGARLSTSLTKKGKVHIVDVTVSYLHSDHLPRGEDVTDAVLDVLFSSLFSPLVVGTSFDSSVFAVEKENLIRYLESEVEDHFYHADVEMARLFFTDPHLQVPKVATVDLVKKETAATAYQAWQRMLRLDKLDIFVVGRVDQEKLARRFQAHGFTYRKPLLEFTYRQDFSPILREKSERKPANQSILELGYSLQSIYRDVNYFSNIVFNGLLGAFSHSKLFAQIREKEGLAYTIGSQWNDLTGLLTVYAGIDKEEKIRVMKQVSKHLLALKQGHFTENELAVTKESLLHAATLAQDSPAHLIEQVYQQQVLCGDYLTWTQWKEGIQSVSREDIVRAVKGLRLQAVYFLEGERI